MPKLTPILQECVLCLASHPDGFVASWCSPCTRRASWNAGNRRRCHRQISERHLMDSLAQSCTISSLSNVFRWVESNCDQDCIGNTVLCCHCQVLLVTCVLWHSMCIFAFRMLITWSYSPASLMAPSAKRQRKQVLWGSNLWKKWGSSPGKTQLSLCLSLPISWRCLGAIKGRNLHSWN